MTRKTPRRRLSGCPFAKTIGVVVVLTLLSGCELNLKALVLCPASGRIEVAAGETIAFEGTAIGGIPFPDEEEPYGFAWHADGNPLDEATSAATDRIQATFANVGTYTVTLTVTDGEGSRDTASVQVVVKPAAEVEAEPLRAVILSPSLSAFQVVKGRSLTFRGAGTGGVPFSGDDGSELEPYGYFWNTLGIAGIENDTSISENFRDVEVTFSETGIFDVAFTVKDSRGAVDTVSIQVTVVSDK